MKIPNKRILVDSNHFYYYGALEILLGVIAFATLAATGWRILYTCPILVCCAWRGACHIARGRRRKTALFKLGEPVKFTVTIEDIHEAKTRAGMEDGLYLGRGFVWGPEHAQAYHELANMPEKSRHFNPMGPDGGNPCIHNLGTYLDEKADQPQIHLLPEHTGIIGLTGVGKTRLLEVILAQIIQKGQPVVIIDPKSDKDLLDVTYQCCLASGCTNRFEYFSLAHPQVSAGMNPFANYSTPGEVAGRITTIMPDSGNSKPFIDFCYDVLAGVAQVLILMDREITIKNLYNFAVLDRKELVNEAKKFRAGHKLSDFHSRQLNEAIAQLDVKIQHDAAHFQKMTTSLMPVLGTLSTGNIGSLLNPERAAKQLTWERIFKDDIILYMSLASMKNSYVSSLVSMLFVQDLVSFCGNEYTRKAKPKDKWLIQDEASSAIHEGYVDVGNKLRAAGVHWLPCMQTTADIEARISEPVSRQIFSLLNNKIYMRILDLRQAEELAESLGTCQVPKRTLTRNLAGTLKGADVQSGELYRSGFSERLDLVDTPLLPKPILSSLPKGQAVLVTQGYQPIKLRIPLLKRDGLPGFSYFEHVAGLYEGYEAEDVNELDPNADLPTTAF
jgi:conjugal transfer pilus assembly protein TraD